MTEKQFNDITKWQKETFGNATALSKIHHLEEEVKELVDNLRLIGNKQEEWFDGLTYDDIRFEYADCLLLIFGSAAAYGMTYRDIVKAIDDKMVINKARTWDKPDENGVVKHVEDNSMDIYSKEGTKVTVDDQTINWGMYGDKEKANKYLKIGGIYTIEKTLVHNWSTEVYLKEFPEIPFNSVHFNKA